MYHSSEAYWLMCIQVAYSQIRDHYLDNCKVREVSTREDTSILVRITNGCLAELTGNEHAHAKLIAIILLRCAFSC